MEQAKTPQPRRILLVEDSKDNQFLVRAYLRQTGYELEIAGDGQMGVEKFTSGNFDLVLMDIQMPMMDGYAATRKIREWEHQHGRPRVPILTLSAHAGEEDFERSRAAGCDAHLTKPIRKTTLLQTLEKYLMPQDVIRVSAPEGLEELLPGYLEKRGADLLALAAALERSDYETIRVLGHNMKGTGGAYGFEAISTIGKSLEASATERRGDGILSQIQALADYLNRVEVVT